MNCWSCQVENPSGAKFCLNCGSRLVPNPATEAPCRSCAAPLPLDARFCGNCGTPDPVVAATPAAAAAPPVATGLADLLEPAPEGDASVGGGEAAALAYDHEEEDEATVLRTGLEEAPMIEPTPGLKSRDRLNTEPAKVAMARTLAERLGKGEGSPGAYSKQGPSLRKGDAKGKPPPPPAIGGAKPATKGKPGVPSAVRKADTEQRMPRAALPAEGGRAATASEKASKLPPAPAIAARPGRPVAAARPAAVPSPATPASAGATSPAPASASAGATSTAPASASRIAPTPPPSSASMTVPAPSRTAPSPASPPASLTVPAPARTGITQPTAAAQPTGTAQAERPKPPRTITEPQKAVFASPSPSEVAEMLAAPDGWPDIADELAEVRFSALQGVDAGVRAELEALRAKYPGHPELEALAAELGEVDDALMLEDSLELPMGVPRRTRPPVQPAAAPATTPVDGPPPLGRFPIGQPTASSPSSPPSSRPGVPQAAPLETSDELLDADGDGFDDLDDDDDDLDASESMTDLTIVERVDLERLGVRDADELDDPDDEAADDIDEPDEPDFVDRTMMVPGLQPPAPYGSAPPSGAATQPPPSRSAVERRATLVPDVASVDERRRTTLPPGSDPREDERHTTLVGSRDDELGSTLPPGGLSAADLDEPTIVGFDDGVPTHALDEPTPAPARATLVPLHDGPPPPAPFSEPAEPPPPESFMTAPDRDADTAAASGTFAVADLDLDDMPDLSSGLPPEPEELDVDLYAASPDPEEPDMVVTQEGTVVARTPLPPAPYGQGQAAVPVTAVRLVMLGARGEPVAERRIEPGEFLDVGRRPGEPWAEDRRMEPLHARLFPGPGGVVVDDFGLPSGVYTQISDTIAVQDGDEFKVGQARLALQRVTGRGWGQLTVVRHDSPAPLTLLLDRDAFIIGRDEGDLTLPSDTFVSGDHCRFLREGNAVYLEDLGSSNGTYIRVRAGQCVAFGALILVGHTQFRVLPG